MYNVLRSTKKWFDKERNSVWYWVGLLMIFGVFVGLHFYKLTDQELMGDEAAPMLLSARIWDAIRLHDWRLLAYPFLFFHEPFRALMSGTLLFFFGVDRVIVRLPGILFDLLTFGTLVWIWRREKVRGWLSVLGMGVYAAGGYLMLTRLALEEGKTRWLILVIGYLIWKAVEEKSGSRWRQAWWVWVVGILSVMDTAALGMVLMAVGGWMKVWKDRMSRKAVWWGGLVLVVYLSVWAILPLKANQMGMVNGYGHRGLWHYVSRVSEGPAREWSRGLMAMDYYSSPLFVGYVVAMMLVSLGFVKLRPLAYVSLPCWLAVLVLNATSIHPLSFVSLFWWQAIVVTDWGLKKMRNRKVDYAVAGLLVVIVVTNGWRMYQKFWSGKPMPVTGYRWGHIDVPGEGYKIDAAVDKIKVEYGGYWKDAFLEK